MHKMETMLDFREINFGYQSFIEQIKYPFKTWTFEYKSKIVKWKVFFSKCFIFFHRTFPLCVQILNASLLERNSNEICMLALLSKISLKSHVFRHRCWILPSQLLFSPQCLWYVFLTVELQKRTKLNRKCKIENIVTADRISACSSNSLSN